ncbi:hypothetical protein [Streptomyces sp. NPDC048419]|uniref:hypothetical protein n=1 Tax=Streptomyces sp. NPDC048419 TaxID=3365547 RepID=UPI0037142BEF
MSGFINRAKREAQRGLIKEGKQKLDEVQAKRAGKRAADDLLKRLGTAYYAEQKGIGTPEATQEALQAVQDHVTEHGAFEV